MIVRETTAPERGNMTACNHGGTRTAIASTAEEATVALSVVAAAAVGAKITSETVSERGIRKETGTGIEIEIEIAAGAGHPAELGLEAGVEVRILLMDLKDT